MVIYWHIILGTLAIWMMRQLINYSQELVFVFNGHYHKGHNFWLMEAIQHVSH